MSSLDATTGRLFGERRLVRRTSCATVANDVAMRHNGAVYAFAARDGATREHAGAVNRVPPSLEISCRGAGSSAPEQGGAGLVAFGLDG